MNRRLAAILAADVVGYSRLMGADESGTIDRMRRLREGVFEPVISGTGGRLVKHIGDGLIAEFPSAVEAVRCAMEMQQALARSEAEAEDAVRLRVGVSLGDLVVDKDDLYGNGVIIATRLEGLAEPGGICISGTAYDMLDDALGGAFEDDGEHNVKNMAKPVRVYRHARPASREAGDARARRGATPSVAVLPFANLSGDPGEEYFCDGITEDVITELSRFRELSVISRNSSFAFRGKSATAREIGWRLGVEYVVEGSIRRVGTRVRVTAQLINAANDAHVWADRYDRDIEDIFAVQDDVVRRIAGTLVGRLEHERVDRAQRQSPHQLRAYDHYLRGREHFFNWSLEDNLSAIEHLEAAVETDPDHAAALAMLSEARLRMFLNAWSQDEAEDLAAALRLADRALRLDDQDSRVHTALGMALIFHRELDRARHHFEEALRLNPNDTRVLVYYARQAVLDGRPQDAVELCEGAMERNPFGKYAWNIAMAQFAARDYQGAVGQITSIANPPIAPMSLLAACQAMLGEAERARETAARFLEAADDCAVTAQLSGPDGWRDFFAARWPFRKPADLDHLLEALARAGLPVAR